jgi:hypothetical protein
MKRICVTLFGLLFLIVSALPLFAQEQDNTEIIATITSQTGPQLIGSRLSDDLRYDFQVLRYDCTPVEIPDQKEPQFMAYEVLTVTDTSQESPEAQIIAEQLLNCQGLGAIGLQIMTLSEDNRYLYYTDAREGQPDGGINVWLQPIYRVDLEDLTTTPLGGGVFSTWRNLLITQEPNQPGQPIKPLMHLYDTSEAEPLASYEIMGEVLWLPDSSGILIIEGDRHLGNYSIVSHIDVETLKLTTLLETGEIPIATAEAD